MLRKLVHFDLNVSTYFVTMGKFSQKDFFCQLEKFSLFQLKCYLGRQRLRLNKQEIAFYLFLFAEHIRKRICFTELYAYYFTQGNLPRGVRFSNYQNVQKKIHLCSKLMEIFFRRHRREKLPSEDTFLFDSALVDCVKPSSIRRKHFEQGNLTCRKDNIEREYSIVGVKLMATMAMLGFFSDAIILSINKSDLTWFRENLPILKLFYLHKTLLCDRGFNAKDIPQRINNAFTFVSPTRNKRLPPELGRLYRSRWKIEKGFKALKDRYGKYRLAPNLAYHKSLIAAEIFFALWRFNLDWQQKHLVTK